MSARILDLTRSSCIEVFFGIQVEYSILWNVQHNTIYLYKEEIFEPNKTYWNFIELLVLHQSIETESNYANETELTT